MSTSTSSDASTNAASAESATATTNGVAAFAIGGLLFVSAPLTAILATLVWAHAETSTEVVVMHAWMARGSVAVVSLIGLQGITAGIRSLRYRDADRRRLALAGLGFSLSVGGLLLWSMAALALLNTTESLLRMYS